MDQGHMKTFDDVLLNLISSCSYNIFKSSKIKISVKMGSCMDILAIVDTEAMCLSEVIVHDIPSSSNVVISRIRRHDNDKSMRTVSIEMYILLLILWHCLIKNLNLKHETQLI